MHADEQVLARKAAPHLLLIGRDHHRIGVLDQHRLDRAAALQRLGLAGQHGADARLIEPPHASIARVEPLDQRPVELVDAAAGMQRAAALVRPGARDGGNAERGVHVRRAVALAREAVAEPEERALVAADQRRERLDVLDGEPGDRARPVRVARSRDAPRAPRARRCSAPCSRGRRSRRGTARASPRRRARRPCRACSRSARSACRIVSVS